MSSNEREIAARLIKESTVNGCTLSLDQLADKITNHVNNALPQMHGYELSKGDRSPLRDTHIARLNVAAREVLGIIPKEKWDHTGKSTIENLFDGIFEPNKYDIGGLVVNTPHGEPLGQIDPNKSLRQQGVKVTSDAPSCRR
jgi:hypothetical protein